MAALSTLIERVRAGLSPVELVYTSHEHWPCPRPSSLPSPRHPSTQIRIAVLDSSFNPPTRAHLALANASRPPAVLGDLADTADYDAKLLLLSVRNADKQLRAGDASYAQRLEMMLRFAPDVRHGNAGTGADTRADTAHDNVAVGIIDAPTFVGKSSALLAFLRHRSSAVPDTSAPQLAAGRDVAPDVRLPEQSTGDGAYAGTELSVQPQLTFLVGMDTLERLFAPRFYESEEVMFASLRQFFSSDGDNARIVCARRSLGPLHQENEAGRKLMQDAEEYLQSGSVSVIDIAETERSISSTMVRQLVKSGDDNWRKLVTPAVAEYIVEHNLYR
ncbi:Nucleotidylyl transferase, partial [Wolfiporia cocos MD-104 SS10]